MNDEIILQKLVTAPSFTSVKTKEYTDRRMAGAKTMCVPTVADVANVIKAIPKGQTKTIAELRHTLALQANTDTACPATLLKYWKWMANLSDELKLKYKQYDIPWWRVLKDGK